MSGWEIGEAGPGLLGQIIGGICLGLIVAVTWGLLGTIVLKLNKLIELLS